MRGRTFRSVQGQTLHYLARAHRRVPAAPIGGPAAWLSEDWVDASAWTETLTEADIAEIEAALAASSSIPLERLQARDVPLPGLQGRIRAWARCVGDGRGFVRIRGVPVARWPAADTERFFWALGQHLGRPGAQNGRGELLGHVRDLRLGRDGQIRQYQTREQIHYHCDAADAVALLCMKTAREGGLSRIASSVAIFDRIHRERPDLARLLFRPMWFDARGDGGVDAFRARPSAFFGGRLRTFYHAEYMRTAARHPGVPTLTPAQHELLDMFDALADSPRFHLEMELYPGDIQILSNHTIVHARTGYTDHDALDERRHLLRLWLSLPAVRSPSEHAGRARALVELVTGLVQRKLSRGLRRA